MKAVAAVIEGMSQALNPIVLPLALVCGMVLAVVAMSLMMICRVRATARALMQQVHSEIDKSSSSVEALRGELHRMSGQIEELQQGAAVAPAPKGTINWNKRSQVLRLYRRGDDPAGIAAAIGVPLQEVDLTVKVHNIVMKSIG